ncbi:Oxidoreductase FAD/NAD(P)-binding domain protein [uncultured Paludibacter sp.]|uniref:Oxidoreductase FAD/NAD(P)-binding domain protein n=1 Tax=uncultured Paludibacter sp. TaxID=497635 RepID=A0A653ACB1_9BACT|nr:Oxidoreductase FAD/NAD(P)-binding domain protein [uncultured Paludibacter sp.]
MIEKRILHKTKVSGIKQIAKDVFVLSFPRGFEFRAGQVVGLDVEENGTPRLYSIASGEKDENIDILFDEKPDGKLTPLLSTLKTGDNIYVSEPFGKFQCGDENAWFIASGTGIAPFVSMLRSGFVVGKKVIHGGRFDENFYFSEMLGKLLGENYIRCCSQQADTKYYKGRLTKWIQEKEELPVENKFYLCGSPEMVVEVRDLLISKGVSFQNIISETYF